MSQDVLAGPETTRRGQEAAPQRPRRFSLSLRGLILLVLLFGAWLGCFVRNVRHQQDAVAAINAVHGSVMYDVEWRNATPSPYDTPWTPRRLVDGRLWGPQWLIDRVGRDYFATVVSANLISSMPNDPVKADDRALAHVGQLGRLVHLDMRGSAFTDAGVAHLRGLTYLRSLDLSGSRISDAGLDRIAVLSSLTALMIQKTQISDAGLSHLKKMPGLRLLAIGGTRISDDGVLELERALPLAQIIREDDLVASAAYSRALADVNFVRSLPLRVACVVLLRGVYALADRNEKAQLVAAVKAVCDMEPSDRYSSVRLAELCGHCVQSLERPLCRDLSAEERRTLQERCAARGIAALRRAVELGYELDIPVESQGRPLVHLPRSAYIYRLNRHPAFQQLVDEYTSKQKQRSVRRNTR